MVTADSYDPEWVQRFQVQRKVLCIALGERITAVEHIGSTAIEGLSAKPIIDIAARAASQVDIFGLQAFVQNAGYALHRTGPKNHAVYTRGSETGRTEILHVFSHADWQLCNQRVFRDKLSHDHVARERYQSLKLKLAASDVSGMEYTAAKRDLIEELLNEERATRGLPPTTAWDK